MTPLIHQHPVTFRDVDVHPVAARDTWAITTAEVALGFGVPPNSVRATQRRHGSDLVAGKHFIPAGRDEGGRLTSTLWTQRGIVRLGFLIRSERARAFRDFAEDLVVSTAGHEPVPAGPRPPKALSEADLAELDARREVEEFRTTIEGIRFRHPEASKVLVLTSALACALQRMESSDPKRYPAMCSMVAQVFTQCDVNVPVWMRRAMADLGELARSNPAGVGDVERTIRSNLTAVA